MKKLIIINADDFGYSKVFNEEILKLAENKQITGISIMINYLKNNSTENQLSEIIKYENILGLHVDFENTKHKEKNDLYLELKKQYNSFIDFFNFKPIFLDMHKYSHKKYGQEAIEKFSKENSIYYRNLTGKKNNLTTTEEKITGSFLDFQEIKNKIETIPNNSSTTILFHPGKYDKNSKSSFNKDRGKDIKNIILLNNFIENNPKEYEKIKYSDL